MKAGLTSLLDLPEPILEGILERLSPPELGKMATTCTFLWTKCTSDHVWEKLFKRKWARVFGEAARRDWSQEIKRPKLLDQCIEKTQHEPNASIWPLLINQMSPSQSPLLSAQSVMALYLSLERGIFWFPAQYYMNSGYVLACFDALFRYSSRIDSFEARFAYNWWSKSQNNIRWERLRVPPMDTCAYDLHTSDCLFELKPGDHVEIQYRNRRGDPFGWWHAVIGHLESCVQQQNCWRCQNNETLILEFNKFPVPKRLTLNRKEHTEQGDNLRGLYGGIRKCNEEETEIWKKLYNSV